jgi:hypothetical protein
MHAQRNLSSEAIEQGVFGLLLADVRWWSEEELVREVGDPVAMADALASLYAAGVVYRQGGLVRVTRAAVRTVALL